jgi:hypothetical protein
MNTTKKKLKIEFEDIFNKLEKTFEYTIVHIEMVPHLYEYETKTIYEMPDGYMNYDKRYYNRKY